MVKPVSGADGLEAEANLDPVDFGLPAGESEESWDGEPPPDDQAADCGEIAFHLATAISLPVPPGLVYAFHVRKRSRLWDEGAKSGWRSWAFLQQYGSQQVSPQELDAVFSTLGALVEYEPALSKRALAVRATYNAALGDLPWSDALEVVAHEWPQWGEPYLIACLDTLDAMNPRFPTADAVSQALALLMEADRRLPVNDPRIRVVLERVRSLSSMDGAQVPTTVLEQTLLMLVHRNPSISNFSNLARFYVSRRRPYDAYAPAVLPALRIHGNDPDRWAVKPRYDDLLYAGRLAGDVARSADEAPAPGLDGPDPDVFMNSALGFCLRAISVALRGEDPSAPRPPYSAYNAFFDNSRIWLARARPELRLQLALDIATNLESCHIENQQFGYRGDDLPRASLETFTNPFQYLAASVLQLIQSSPKVDYSKYRMYWQILAADSSTASSSANYAAFLMEKFDALYLLAHKDAKERTSELGFEGFLQRDDLDSAAKLAANYGGVAEGHLVALRALQSARKKWRTGSNNEALRTIVPLVANIRILPEELAIALVRELNEVWTAAPDSVQNAWRQRIHLAMSDGAVGLAIAACSAALAARDSQRAAQWLDILQLAKDSTAPNVTDLRLRLLLLRASADDADSTALLRQQVAPLLSDPSTDSYLRGRAFQILGQYGDAGTIQPTLAWQRACKTHSSPRDRAFNQREVLAWQARACPLDGWGQRLLDAVESAPDADFFAHLVPQAWDQRGADLLPELTHVLAGAAFGEQTEQTRALIQAIPADALFDRRILSGFGTATEEGVNPRWNLALRTFVDTLVRAQISASAEVREQRTIATAEWLASCYRTFAPAWTQWLGSGRTVLEHAVTARLRTRFDDFRAGLEQLPSEREPWAKALSQLLRREPVPAATPSADTAAADIVRHCLQAQRSFAPTRPDSSYWHVLDKRVQCWLDTELNQADVQAVAAAAAALWLQLVQSLEEEAEDRLWRQCWSLIHQAKGALIGWPTDGVDLPAKWSNAFTPVLDKTQHFLSWQRWPDLTVQDLCGVVEQAVYSPPNVPAFMTGPRGYVPRPRLALEHPHEELKVSVDAEFVATAVQALLDNAAEHAGEGGWILLRLERAGNEALLTITNSGNPVESHVLDRLNDPENRGFSCSNSTGYGTIFCRQVVRYHDGTLAFRSSPGAVFEAEIRLPLVEQIKGRSAP